jgi:hypothetical protein
MTLLSRSAPALLRLMSAIALLAATATPGLADSSEPGSIIVYQKFQKGFVTVDAGQPTQTVQPRTLIELGATCPVNMDCGVQDLVVAVEFRWVCPAQPDNAGAQFSDAGICVENDFLVRLTVNGKVWFSPNGGATSGDLAGQIVPQAPCGRGYLIGSVANVSGQSGPSPGRDFQGLIGDAVMRNTPQDLQAFRAVTIQGDTNQFLGVGLAGDVRFDSDVTAPFADTALIFLTLDVLPNQENQPTFIALNFFNAQQQGFSEAVSFTCWAQINITTIDGSLTQEGIGSARGQFQTYLAYNSGQTAPTCPDGSVGCVTLIGAAQVTEGPMPGPANATRSYTVPVFEVK